MPTTTIITGSSRGLGRALALSLASPGARLGLVARESEALRDTARAARERGATVLAVAADLGEVEAAPGLAARLLEGLGSPSLLVLGASTLGAVPLAQVLDTPDEVWLRTFQVNVLGGLALARRLVPAMILAGGGTVVGVSSDAAVEAYPSWGAYGASKAALDHALRTWAAELEGTGLRLLSVDPGEMDTAMHHDALPEVDPATLQRPEAVARRLLALLATPVPSGSRITLPDWGGAA